jgi:hypothetical protein
MSGHGTKDLPRAMDDGTKRTPSWNAPLTKLPLNQGGKFQQELIDRGLRSEQNVAEYMKGRTNERR